MIKKTISIIFPLLLVLYELAAYLSNDMYLPALPQMMHEFHASYSSAQTTLTSWFIGSASMQLLLGPLSDRYGRRPVLLLGGWFFIIATLLCAITPNINGFIIGRFLQGTAICSLIVAGYASIHELLDHKQAILTLAWMGNITLLAPAFGPLVGSLILIFFHWKFIYYSQSLWAFIIIILLFKYMPESNPKEKQHPINLKNLVKNYYGILSNKRFCINLLSFCLLFSVMIAWITAGPFLVITEFKNSAVMFGVYQACIFCCFMLGTRFVNLLIDKISINNIIYIGLAVLLFGALLSIPLALLMPHHLLGIIISMMIFSGGSGLVFPPLNRLSIESSTEPMGARVAIFSLCMNAFGAFGSILVSIFYDKTLASISFIIASITVIACFMQWKFKPNQKFAVAKLDN